ncbi:hypothetical protein D3C75_649290 [compost metagenome]
MGQPGPVGIIEQTGFMLRIVHHAERIYNLILGERICLKQLIEQIRHGVILLAGRGLGSSQPALYTTHRSMRAKQGDMIFIIILVNIFTI